MKKNHGKLIKIKIYIKIFQKIIKEKSDLN